MMVKVETVKPKELLNRALQKMVKRNVGSVVVVEGKKPVGIITERDVSRCVARGTKTLKTQVKNLMSTPLITIARSAAIQEAMMIMLKHGIRRLPVVEKEKLVGIISERDLLRWTFRVTQAHHVSPEIQAILDRPPFSKE